MTPARIEQIARECGWGKATSMDDCMACGVFSLEGFARAIRNEALEDMWQKVNALIIPGELQGNGCDQTAKRNGLIIAANEIMKAMDTPPQSGR